MPASISASKRPKGVCLLSIRLTRRRFLPLLATPMLAAMSAVIRPSSVAATGRKYSITDLGALQGGDYSIGYGINPDAAVAGMSSVPGGATRAVILRGKKLTDLGQDGDTSTALGINEAGWVVGGATTAPGFEYGGAGTHAFLWKDEILFDLGAPEGADVSVANDVNTKGEVVGFGGDPKPKNPNNAQQALFWDEKGKMFYLNDTIDDDNGWTLLTALAINDDDRIAGLGMKDGQYRGYLLKKK